MISGRQRAPIETDRTRTPPERMQAPVIGDLRYDHERRRSVCDRRSNAELEYRIE